LDATALFENDMPPTSAPATWFPGALPRQTMKQLKDLDKDLELKWNPAAGNWEVWHNRNGKPYVFYRHMFIDGTYMPAESNLMKEVTSRAMWTPHGQEVLRQAHRRAYDLAHKEGHRDPERPAWDENRRMQL
jgi:hypothetical protein